MIVHGATALDAVLDFERHTGRVDLVETITKGGT
jgi:hypothetical protein